MTAEDPLDVWLGTVTVAWTGEDAGGRYVEEIRHTRTWLQDLVRRGSPSVAAAACRLLLDLAPLTPESRAVIAQRYRQEA